MYTLIATIILLVSFLGIAFILYKKIPALAKMPQNGTSGILKSRVVLKAKNKVDNIYSLFSKQIILHKLLSWVKVMTLKIETKIDSLLHRIRRKAQEADKEITKK